MGNATTHGLSSTPLYAIWRTMRARCLTPTCREYPQYGGRGITICAEWEEVTAFSTWATMHGYRPGLLLDRVDNDGPYAPDNCRWTDRVTSNRNRRTAISVTAFGETKVLSAWAADERCSVPYRTLHKRITELAWEPERAISTGSTTR